MRKIVFHIIAQFICVLPMQAEQPLGTKHLH